MPLCMPVLLGRMVFGMVPLRPVPFCPGFMPLVAFGMMAAPFSLGLTLAAGVAGEGCSQQQSGDDQSAKRNTPRHANH